MAKYDVTYSCGHSGEVQLFGPGKERERKLEWYHNSADCPDCYRKLIEENRQRLNQEAKETAESKGLPKLTGSEKQVAWAEKIRIGHINKIDEFLNKKQPGSTFNTDEYQMYVKPIDDIMLDVRTKLLEKQSASWWIDRRDKPFDVIYEESFPDLRDKHKQLNDKAREYVSQRESQPKAKEPTITYLEGNKDVRSEPGTETVIKIEKPKPLLLSAPNINKIESERSKLSQSQDVNKKHSIIITQDSPRIKVWIKNPGSMDVLGVDTPKFVTKISKPHIPKEPKPKVSRPKIKRKASHPINGIIKHRR